MFASLLVLMLAVQGGVSKAEADPKPPTSRIVDGHSVTDAAWDTKPSRADVLAVFPERAATLGVGGTGGVACTVGADGHQRDCGVAGEEPAGFGFGDAAMALVPAMRFKPATRDGLSVESRIRIPIRFDPPALPDGVGSGAAAWRASPSAAQVVAVYPAGALKARRSGKGVIRCTVRGGALGACTPQGDDADRFSRAAIKLSGAFLMDDAFIGGGATNGAIVDIPVAFSTDPASAGVPAGQPVWTRSPSPELIAAMFPSEARSAGHTRIEVVQTCRLQPDGGLGDCATAAESPAGFGGALAAARLMQAYQTSTWSRTGTPTAGLRVQLPIILEDRTIGAVATTASTAPVPASRRPAR